MKRLGLKLDAVTFILTAAIGLIGIVLIASARADEPGNFVLDYSSKRQLIFLLVGLFLMTVVAHIDYRLLCRIAWPTYVFFLVLLLGVLIFGKLVGGSRRWLPIFGFYFQPSEFMKVIVILLLCDFLSKNLSRIQEGLCIITAVAAIVPPLLLIILQPDLGTSLCFIPILLGVLLMGDVSIGGLMKVIGSGLLLVPIGWIFLQDYQHERILSFLRPEDNILGPGWQPYQSKIAIGSGGFNGEGLFNGPQNMLDFIPGQHTDFIFTVIAEERGFIGSIFLLGLFFALLLRAVQTAFRTSDPLAKMIIGGVVAWISFQVFVNIGMSLGIMPVTGLPLPLLSYGGSNLIATLIGIGLLMSVYNFCPRMGRLT